MPAERHSAQENACMDTGNSRMETSVYTPHYIYTVQVPTYTVEVSMGQIVKKRTFCFQLIPHGLLQCCRLANVEHLQCKHGCRDSVSMQAFSCAVRWLVNIGLPPPVQVLVLKLPLWLAAAGVPWTYQQNLHIRDISKVRCAVELPTSSRDS